MLRSVTSGFASVIGSLARAARVELETRPTSQIPGVLYPDPQNPSATLDLSILQATSGRRKPGTRGNRAGHLKTSGKESVATDSSKICGSLAAERANASGDKGRDAGIQNGKESVQESQTAADTAAVGNQHAGAGGCGADKEDRGLAVPLSINADFVVQQFYQKTTKDNNKDGNNNNTMSEGDREADRGKVAERSGGASIDVKTKTKDADISRYHPSMDEREGKCGKSKQTEEVAILKIKLKKSDITNTIETAKRNVLGLMPNLLMKQDDRSTIRLQTISNQAADISGKTHDRETCISRKDQERESIEEFENDIDFLSKCNNRTSTPDKRSRDHHHDPSRPVLQPIVPDIPGTVLATPSLRYADLGTPLTQPKVPLPAGMVNVQSPLAKSTLPAKSPSMNRHAQAVYPEISRLPAHDAPPGVDIPNTTTASTEGPAEISKDTDLAVLTAAQFKAPTLPNIDGSDTANIPEPQPVLGTLARRCLSFGRPTPPSNHVSSDGVGFEPIEGRSTGGRNRFNRRFQSETEEAVYYLIKKYLQDD